MGNVLPTRRKLFEQALSGMLVTALAAEFAQAKDSRPLLWALRKGNSAVYLFPFGDAEDESWFDQRIKAALARSSELWLEVGRPLPDEQRKALLDALARLDGQTLFDVLPARVRDRAATWLNDLEIPREMVEHVRPWLAYYTYAAAFERKYGDRRRAAGATPALSPDMVLVRQALSQGNALRAEFTMEQVYRRMAAMPDQVQSDYLSWLFDYFEDERRHRNQDRFDWVHGRLTSRSIHRMRSGYRELYEVMDGERNRWWAQKISDLVSAGSNAFLAIGQNHFADTQGILTQLRRLRMTTTVQLVRS